ncbi:hypothetical protein GCM10027443_11250 [Pontibacter brevis]
MFAPLSEANRDKSKKLIRKHNCAEKERKQQLAEVVKQQNEEIQAKYSSQNRKRIAPQMLLLSIYILKYI